MTEDPNRLHYIPEWAEKRGLRQADIVRELQEAGATVDKASVSRWFSGSMPDRKNLLALQALFGLDETASLFRHPDNDWIERFFSDKNEEERQRIQQMLEAAFPKAS